MGFVTCQRHTPTREHSTIQLGARLRNGVVPAWWTDYIPAQIACVEVASTLYIIMSFQITVGIYHLRSFRIQANSHGHRSVTSPSSLYQMVLDNLPVMYKTIVTNNSNIQLVQYSKENI